MRALALLCLLPFVSKSAPPQPVPPSSTSYSLTHAAVLPGASLGASSASYQADFAIDRPGSGATGAPSAVLRGGFVGQIHHLQSLSLQPDESGIDEDAAIPFEAFGHFDDGSRSTLDGFSLVQSGGLSQLANELVAAPVFQDEMPTAQLSFGGLLSPEVTFSVYNIESDNFGGAAGDGIDDAWQMAHFDGNGDGIIDEPELAAPDADPDADGDDNRFESLAGSSPIDPDDWLGRDLVRVDATTTMLTVGEVRPGTRYSFRKSADLVQWDLVERLTPAALASDHAFTDHAAGTRQFYRLDLDRVRGDVIRFRFDDGAMGWTGGPGTVVSTATAGQLDIDDGQTVAYLQAPSLMLGDLRAYDGGSLQFDARAQAGSGAPVHPFGAVQLWGFDASGSPQVIERNVTAQVGAIHTVAIDRPGGMSAGDWLAFLADITAIRLYVDLTDADDDQVEMRDIALRP